MLIKLLPDTKEFMNHLLINDTFDNFSLIETNICTYMTTKINGHINNGFFSEDELSQKNLTDCDYLPWTYVKPFVFSLIKGKRTPLSFKITLSLSKENIKNVLKSIKTDFTIEQVSGLIVNFSYKNNQITFTTATSISEFTLDKTLEREWDELFIKFLKSKKIVSTQLN